MFKFAPKLVVMLVRLQASNFAAEVAVTRFLTVSSVMFSLAHVFSEGSFFVALLSGFYLGMIYVRTKDVKVCILVHVSIGG